MSHFFLPPFPDKKADHPMNLKKNKNKETSKYFDILILQDKHVFD